MDNYRPFKTPSPSSASPSVVGKPKTSFADGFRRWLNASWSAQSIYRNWCNRIANNVSWGACGLVSFGAQNAVAIFCPKSAQILATLPGHKAYVNCTHWLPSNKFSFKEAEMYNQKNSTNNNGSKQSGKTIVHQDEFGH